MRKSVIVTIVFSAVAFVLLLFCVVLIRHQRFSNNFENLKIGETRKDVIYSLGEPASIARCGDSTATDEFHFKCREEYWYFSFLERWIVYLDQDGKVIDKSYAVLP